MMLTYDFFGRSIHENKLVFDHITCVFQDVWCHHPASLKTSPRSQKCFYGICLPWLSLLVTLPWVCSHFMIINHCKICTISVGEPAVWACQLWFQLCQVTIFSGYATAAVNHVNATVSVSDCMTRTTSCCFDVFSIRGCNSNSDSFLAAGSCNLVRVFQRCWSIPSVISLVGKKPVQETNVENGPIKTTSPTPKHIVYSMFFFQVFNVCSVLPRMTTKQRFRNTKWYWASKDYLWPAVQ